MNSHVLMGVFVFCLGILSPLAASASPDFKFTYLQGVYTVFDREVSDGDGYGIDGSYHLPSGVLFGAGAGKTDFDTAFDGRVDDLDSTYYHVNAGYAENLMERSALWFRVGYARAETDSSMSQFDDIDEDTQSFDAGIRSWFLPGLLEGHASAAALRIESGDTAETGARYLAGLRLHLGEHFLVGASIARTFVVEDTDVFTVEARLQL